MPQRALAILLRDTMQNPESHIYLVEVHDSDWPMYEAGWYFADETAELHGPFATIEETRKLLIEYAASLG